MKGPEKKPGSYIVSVFHRRSSDGLAQKQLIVRIKGIQSGFVVDWDFSEPRGGFYAAAKKIAQQRGFDDVKETGVLRRGHGFVFEPVLKERK